MAIYQPICYVTNMYKYHFDTQKNLVTIKLTETFSITDIQKCLIEVMQDSQFRKNPKILCDERGAILDVDIKDTREQPQFVKQVSGKIGERGEELRFSIFDLKHE